MPDEPKFTFESGIADRMNGPSGIIPRGPEKKRTKRQEAIDRIFEEYLRAKGIDPATIGVGAMYGRYVKAAQEILEYSQGDIDRAADAVVEIGAWLNGLEKDGTISSWTLYSIGKNYLQWWSEKQKHAHTP